MGTGSGTRQPCQVSVLAAASGIQTLGMPGAADAHTGDVLIPSSPLREVTAALGPPRPPRLPAPHSVRVAWPGEQGQPWGRGPGAAATLGAGRTPAASPGGGGEGVWPSAGVIEMAGEVHSADTGVFIFVSY